MSAAAACRREDVVAALLSIASIARARSVEKRSLNFVAIAVERIACVIDNEAPDGSCGESKDIGCRLCRLATQCLTIDRRISVDIWLISADYYAFVAFMQVIQTFKMKYEN